MPRKLFRPAIIAAAVLGASAAQASEDAVKRAMEAFIGQPVVESVKRTSYGGLYEVVLDNGELIYTDARVSFIIDGHVIDTRSRQNVTQARLNELAAIDFSILPLDQAIKQVRGDGKRVLVTFEDPNCGYCRRLAKDLVQMDNVTIYTFLYPILSADSTEKSRNIWCARDRVKAWNDWTIDGKAPAAASCDSSVVDRNVALGQSLRITGTPTMFLADGTRIGGYLPPAQLEAAVSGAAR